MKKFLYILLLLVTHSAVKAQSISISGSIYGFFGEKVMLMKKASKNLGFEGPISDVKINVKSASTNLTQSTDISGAYTFSISGTGQYTITISKKGYSTLSYVINYEDAGSKSVYSLISFIVRKDDQSVNNIGSLSINDQGALVYKATEAHQKNGNQDVIQSNKLLFEKAVTLNNSSKSNIVSNPLPRKEANALRSDLKKQDNQDLIENNKTHKQDSIAIKHNNDLISALNKAIEDSTASGSDIRKQIELSKQLLSSYNTSDPNYQMLLNQIKNAEAQLALKENNLKIQEKELSQTRKIIIFMILLVIIAIGLIAFMYYFIKEKKKFNTELSEKNTQISKINTRLISSIKYASVIQTNLLMDKANLKKLFSNSFVYYKPKDFLSGDFYWFGEYEDVKLIIAADCTGHGVPGALLTVLGHGIIEDLIEKKKITSPGQIISELNAQLNQAFSNQNLMEYGIELTVLSFKRGGKEAVFASNGHGIYKQSNGEMLHYLPIITRSGGSNPQPVCQNVNVEFKTDDCFFLMSDGYADQFKGESAKPEKYNLRRFETLLSRISSKTDISLAEKELDEEFVKWKGNKDQTDDVLVIGIRM